MFLRKDIADDQVVSSSSVRGAEGPSPASPSSSTGSHEATHANLYVILLLSVVIPLATKLLLKDSVRGIETLLLGFLISIVGLLVRLDERAAKMERTETMEWRELRGRHVATWVSRGTDIDESLIAARNTLHQLQRKGEDFFAWYFEQYFLELNKKMQEAHSTNRLDFKPTWGSRLKLLECVEKGAVLRFVHFFADNDRYFGSNQNWKAFYQDIDDALASGRVAAVQRLFIYEDEEERQNPRARSLVKQHAVNGYECKELAASDYEGIKKDFRIVDTHDFGIYGDIVYRWAGRPSHEEKGSALSDRKDVQLYVDFFKQCWRTAE